MTMYHVTPVVTISIAYRCFHLVQFIICSYSLGSWISISTRVVSMVEKSDKFTTRTRTRNIQH